MVKLFFTIALFIFALIISIVGIAYIINFVDLSIDFYSLGRVFLVGLIVSFSGGGLAVFALSAIRQITRIIKEKDAYRDELPREPSISIGKIRASMGRISRIKHPVIFVYVSVFLAIVIAAGIIWKVVYNDIPSLARIDSSPSVANNLINPQEYVEISDEDLKNIIGTAQISSMYRIFSGRIYNGCSNWAVKKMIVRITVQERDGATRWSRDFNMNIDLNPLSVKSFTLDISDVDNIGTFQWHIMKVWGYRSKGS